MLAGKVSWVAFTTLAAIFDSVTVKLGFVTQFNSETVTLSQQYEKQGEEKCQHFSM